MKVTTILLLFLLIHQHICSQVPSENKDRRLRGLPSDYKRGPGDPPMRGEKDLRPKQFPSATRQLQHKDISSVMKSFYRMKTGDSTLLPVAGISDLHVVLKRFYTTAHTDAWSFKVMNDLYKGGWVFINRVKKTDGSVSYFGHYIRKGYADGLMLHKEGNRVYFEIVEQETIVQD